MQLFKPFWNFQVWIESEWHDDMTPRYKMGPKKKKLEMAENIRVIGILGELYPYL